ncbi:MAG: rod shape-determining protein MreC [Phycisphaerae bacterium]
MPEPKTNTRKAFAGLTLLACVWLLVGMRMAPYDRSGMAPSWLQQTQDFFGQPLSFLLTPLCQPLRWVQTTMESGFNDINTSKVDSRRLETLEQENIALKNQNMLLQDRLNQFERFVGEFQQFRAAFPTVSADQVMPATIIGMLGSNGSEIAAIDRGSVDHIQLKQVVLSQLAPIGRVVSVGTRTSHVRLLTDPDSSMKITASVIRREADKIVVIAEVCMVHGVGNGMLGSDTLSASLRVPPQAGDWITLQDNEWPKAIQGAVVGQVESVARREDQQLRYELRIKPRIEVNRTTRVMLLMQ